MARKPRIKSRTGIYHVMLRGINKQDIFFERDDFVTMQRVLREAKIEKDMGRIVGYGASYIYAYCILHNHCHILIREGSLDVSSFVKRIAERFAVFYNKKYERVGHLFQGRYASEPVNDEYYFRVLLRYIHQNPVKAMECKGVEEYEYSSWREYIPDTLIDIPVCDVRPVLNKYGFESLKEWVSQTADDYCLDMDNVDGYVDESRAWKIMAEICGEENPEDFRRLSPEWQLTYIEKALKRGISIRQASRFSSLSYYMLRKHLNLLSKDEEVEYRSMTREINSTVLLPMPTEEKMKAIVTHLMSSNFCTSDDLALNLGVSVSTIKRCLYRLVAEGYIKPYGANRNRTYTLAASIREQ